MSAVFNSLLKGLNTATLGLTGSLLGDLEIDMPEPPKQPDKIQTGEVVKEKAGGSFDEDAESKTNARRTARKGTSQFRIPLASTASKTGTATGSGGSTGLKI